MSALEQLTNARSARPVEIARGGADPYLTATLWLLDRPHAVVVAGPAAVAAASVHARALLDGTVPAHPRALDAAAAREGLGVVLAAPTARQLERVERSLRQWSADCFLIRSDDDPRQRAFQSAWAWARRTSTQADTPADSPDDPAGVPVDDGELTPVEEWALALRLGHEATARRLRAQLEGRVAVRRFGLRRPA